MWVLCMACALFARARADFTSTSTDSIANKTYAKLNEYLEGLWNIQRITKKYNQQTYVTLTGHQILEKLKENVTKQFLNSENSLANIRQSALDSFYNYTGDRHTFDFLERFKNRTTNRNLPMHYYKTANFKRNVSITNSSLVLPIDVYYNWSEVRETILWTEKMDTTFMKNWSPNLTGSATMLQYIGTPHGVMRVYPSYYTPRIGKWITYDHRFRIWYAVGAMESNKVVFLMDKSGTLVGEPVKLMRAMAINIIKTMISDEDYISVLTFNQKTEPLGCGSKLIRARGRIKTILNEQIRKIKPEGAGNLTEAIGKGFEVLNSSNCRETCHKTLVLFTDYTQVDLYKIINRFNMNGSVKVVILQVGKDIMFSTDLSEVAVKVKGTYARIRDLSDINPTVLKLTGEYTSLVDDDDLQKNSRLNENKKHGFQNQRKQYIEVKATPMYKDASTEEYITTLVLPVVTDKKANWTFGSKLIKDRGSFLGVAAVDIESKSLGQYPLSNTRGCYSITVDNKGSVLYHPVLYRTKEAIEIDQKLYLYSFLNEGDTMKRAEERAVFQKKSSGFQSKTISQLELDYIEMADTSMSLRKRSFVNKYYFNIMAAVENKVSLVHICNRKSLSFPTYSNVMNKKVTDIPEITVRLGRQIDKTRDKAYCNYTALRYNDPEPANETVEHYVKRKLQFPECYDVAFETFDDIFMVTRYLKSDLERNSSVSATTASGNRFEITPRSPRKLQRTNSQYTRERYNRLISLITNNNNNNEMIALHSVTNSISRRNMFEISRVIYHTASDSYPLMLSVEITQQQLDLIIQEPFRNQRSEMGGQRYLVDENAFVISSDDVSAHGKHLAKLFPRLMQALLEKRIYGRHNHTECYFSCEEDYPFDSNRTMSSAYSVRNHFPTHRLVQDFLYSATSVLARLISNFMFFILTPISMINSLPDSLQSDYVDWKVIKINLTCCYIHPFFSRNFSVPVGIGNSIGPTDNCMKKFRYAAVENTNLFFVWVFCTTEFCECDAPTYELKTISNKTLNPCNENDDNYNPNLHCTAGTKNEIAESNTAFKSSVSLLLISFVMSLMCFTSNSYK